MSACNLTFEYRHKYARIIDELNEGGGGILSTLCRSSVETGITPVKAVSDFLSANSISIKYCYLKL